MVMASGSGNCQQDPHFRNRGVPSMPARQQKAMSSLTRRKGLQAASLDTGTSV